MGIFQRYIKTDKNANPIIGKDGKPKREGPWFVQYPHARDPETGKIQYRTEKASFSKKKAEKIFRAKVDAFQEMDQLGIQANPELTFSKFMDWGLSQDIMKAKASASDDLARAVHLKGEFGNRKTVQITPLMVDNFRVKMKKTNSERTGKPYSGASINKMVSLARRVYYLGMDAGLVKSNPFARRGTFKEEPKGHYIPDQEFWKIYKYLPDYLKAVVLVAYLTGMRRGEILELEWDRVNLSEGYVDLTPEDTKTEEPRRIYFNSIKELKDVFIEADRKKRVGQQLVFTKSDGSSVPKWYIQRLFKKACLNAKVHPYRLHDLRHSFNTNMTKAGVDQVVIMKLTGHKTFAMFSRYSHLDKEQGESAMEKLNGLLSLKSGNAQQAGSKNKKAER
jgi:integrase